MAWKYLTYHFPDSVLCNPDGYHKELDAYGARGWELVSVVHNAFGTFMFFKRPISSD